MRIDIVGRDIEITPAIRQYAEQKVSKLTRYFDGIQQITVTIHRAHHSHHTQEFTVELVADVEKHKDFIAHDTGPDLYAVLDQTTEKCARQLKDFKEQLKNH
ncbi:MAG: ribosome-associated translation inhibitor RaiA [Phycisphaerales bacterium]|nr:ribosome-associated translation inhibitor RaiA [Phycisphaerales bacterium]